MNGECRLDANTASARPLFSPFSVAWKRTEKVTNPKSTTNGSKFESSPETQIVKKINNGGLGPESPKSPKTGLRDQWSRKSRNIFSFGTNGTNSKTGAKNEC